MQETQFDHGVNGTLGQGRQNDCAARTPLRQRSANGQLRLRHVGQHDGAATQYGLTQQAFAGAEGLRHVVFGRHAIGGDAAVKAPLLGKKGAGVAAAIVGKVGQHIVAELLDILLPQHGRAQPRLPSLLPFLAAAHCLR